VLVLSCGDGISRGEPFLCEVVRIVLESPFVWVGSFCNDLNQTGDMRRFTNVRDEIPACDAQGRKNMEPEMIPLNEIKIDPLAQELVRSEQARPYTDYFMKSYSNDAAGVESALQVLRDLPLEKRYTWRVFSALKWAFADFDDECIRLDLPHIPESERTEMVKELQIRFLQMEMLLKVFKS